MKARIGPSCKLFGLKHTKWLCCTCMATFHTCLTIGLIQLLISFKWRAPWYSPPTPVSPDIDGWNISKSRCSSSVIFLLLVVVDVVAVADVAVVVVVIGFDHRKEQKQQDCKVHHSCGSVLKKWRNVNSIPAWNKQILVQHCYAMLK